MQNQTFTLTFGDQAENHVGMQKIGQRADTGFTLEDLQKAQQWFESQNVKTELIHLNSYLDGVVEVENAYVLIIRQGLNAILSPENADQLFQEQDVLEKDTKAYMYGRVVNKRARYNLCFGPENQEPNYEQGKGRIIAFHQVPLLNKLRQRLPEIIGEKDDNLMAEGNYYYDIKKTGIGWHGDGERKRVIAVRLGATLPLHYHWFYQGKPVGRRVKLELNHADIYIMSEKATGYDWKRRVIPTLRHAAGAPKYLKL